MNETDIPLGKKFFDRVKELTGKGWRELSAKEKEEVFLEIYEDY